MSEGLARRSADVPVSRVRSTAPSPRAVGASGVPPPASGATRGARSALRVVVVRVVLARGGGGGEVYDAERAIHLVTELCTGGELFDRIAALASFSEA